jgi:hypothetical protein
MRQDSSKDITQAKYFNNDGSIEEGEFNRSGLMINGCMWVLKDDKTHDKFHVVNRLKGAFICNEKIY